MPDLETTNRIVLMPAKAIRSCEAGLNDYGIERPFEREPGAVQESYVDKARV